jgi:DNA-binding CsgD family transcriptional regulator
VRSATPTGREREVLRLVALGYRNREIAERLGISIRTVEAHRGRAMGTIDAASRADVVHWAIENELMR